MYVCLFKKLPNSCLKWLYHFSFLPAMYGNCNCCISYQHLVLSVFVLAVLVGVNWYLSVVLICISLKTNDIGSLLMCLVAIYIPFLLKYLRLLPFKKCALFGFLLLISKNSLYIPDTNSCQIYVLQIFSSRLWFAYSFL
uniref:cDNA FLJ27418 fis, clone WMC07037 n=1 Tax=Homo sapiens TaxID=9606 RepID=Q6ZNN9_HUMAN|nr:unnamed protein product [Homo sapiens]